MKAKPRSNRTPRSFRLPDDLMARASKKAAYEGRTVTEIVEESLSTYVARRPLLGCCTHVRTKGSAMPVATSSIPVEEWGTLAR